MDDEDCGLINIVCHGKNLAKDTVSSTVGGIIEDFTNQVLQGVGDVLSSLMTVWLGVPSASTEATDPIGAAIIQTQGYLNSLTLFFGILGILIAAGQMVWSSRLEPLRNMFGMLARVVIVQGAAVSAVTILTTAGDEMSVWMVNQAIGENFNQELVTLFPFLAVGAAGTFTLATGGFAAPVAAVLIIGIIVLISAAMQFLFMVLKDILLAIILVALPTLAAASMTRGGSEGFAKAQGWIVAMLLYKPTAAAIYVLGILMTKNVAPASSDSATQLASMLLGMLTLAVAVLALPVLIKFVAPAVGRGVSSAFSGASGVGMAAGAVATGAAIVGIAATGGAGAAAGGAAAGGSAAGATGSSAAGGTTASATGSTQAIPSSTTAGTAGSSGASKGNSTGVSGATGQTGPKGQGVDGANGKSESSSSPGGAASGGANFSPPTSGANMAAIDGVVNDSAGNNDPSGAEQTR